jgi:hypothetical protein
MTTSSDQSPQRWFFYNGNALALGGRVSRPYCDVIEPQAAAVLPIVGGHGYARVEGFRYRDLVSFRSATTTVSGSPSGPEKQPIFNTLASVTLEGLDVAGVVTADRIVARLVSEHTGADHDLPILPVGTSFENLRIGGAEIVPDRHEALFGCATLRDVQGLWGRRSGIIGFSGKPLRALSRGGHLLTSLYRPPSGLAPGCRKTGGWGIEVEGFGTVYLGELLVARGERRLTMIRIEMGSPVRASLALGYVGGNGTTHP